VATLTHDEQVNHKVIQQLHRCWGLPLVRTTRPPRPSGVRRVIAEAGGKANLLAGLSAIGPFDVVYTDFTELRYAGTTFGVHLNQLLMDLWAPGYDVSTYNYKAPLQGAGTSFSAAHVSGVLTRLRARYPNDTPAQHVARLQSVCPGETDLERAPPAVFQKRVCWSSQWN
jgi:hypothetical protein